jgi:outer membrane protein assembly factor BamA
MNILVITRHLILAAAAVAILTAQDEPTRAAEIAAQQNAKAGAVKPESPNKVEHWLLRFQEERMLDRIFDGVAGFHAKLGGLAPGSGFAFGPAYRRTGVAGGMLTVGASASSSFRGYRKFDFDVAAPKLDSGRFFAEFYGVHHNYPSLSYYGSGARSEKAGRSDFRLEDTAIDGTIGVRPVKRLSAGASLGYVWNNIGPGTDHRYTSADLVYSPSQAPGIDRQGNYLRTGAFVQYDWRDRPSGPRSGGNYFAQFSDYRDRTLGLGDFRRLDLEAQQYVPLLNQRRVFALRAKSALTFRENGQTIPFYLQPSLGGSEDLRGYRPFRFRDDNLFVANAEYRWEVFSGLDMALFADAGKVFARRSNFDLNHMETDLGFGFRFNARNVTFLRLDVGFSHEGFQVWVKFSNIFKKGPIHTSSSMGDF